MTMATLETLGPIERALVLRAVPLLSGMPAGQLTALAQLAVERGARAGEVLQAAGRGVRAMAVLLDGRVRLERDGRHVGQLEAPDTLGLLELLAEQPAPATIVAATPVALLAIDAAIWWDVLEEDLSLLVQLRHTLGRALAAADAAQGAYDLAAPPASGAGDPAAAAPPSDLVDRLNCLHHVPMLRPFGVAVLAELLRDEDERRLAAGEALLRAGEAARELVIIADGAVDCRAPGAAPTRVGAGAVLGANAALCGLPHAYDAVVAAPGSAIAIDAARLWDVAEDHFHVARALLAQAALQALTRAAPVAAGATALPEGSTP